MEQRPSWDNSPSASQTIHTHIHIFYGSISVLQRQRDVEQVINTQNFTENDGSQPSSQKPTTSPYPQPDQSSLCPSPCYF